MEKVKKKRVKKDVCVRAYTLKAYGNSGKNQIGLYAINRFENFCQHFSGKAVFEKEVRSTKDMGWMANKAQYYCRDKASKLKKASKATGNKYNVPQIRKEKLELPVTMEKSRSSYFDYWVKISDQFPGGKPVKIPVKSHKALNQALKDGWSLTKSVSLKMDKDGLKVIVFVERKKPKAEVPVDCIGVDVGIRRAISLDNGFHGKNLGKVIKKEKKKRSEQYRQRTKYGQEIRYKKKNEISRIKQELNLYAKSIIRRSEKLSVGVACEASVNLNNLKSGKLQGWARVHLANRLQVLGKEQGVFVVEVHPAYTSKKCPACRVIGERNNIWFRCGNEKCERFSVLQDADTVGAENVKIEGKGILGKIILLKRSGPSASGFSQSVMR